MKRFTFRAGLVCVALLICLTGLTGCGQKSTFSAEDGNGEYGTDGTVLKSTGVNYSEDASQTQTERKIVITADYSIRTQNFAQSVKALEEAVTAGGGYIESSSVEGDDADGSARYTLRIPATNLNAFATALESVGTIESRSQQADDITDAYYDVDARRKAAEAHRDRLIELVKEASNLDELLKLENELSDVQASLDSLTGQQKRYDNQVSYSTVNVSLWQSDLTVSQNKPYGKRLTEAFCHSFETAFEVIKDLFVVIIWLLPLLIVASIVLVIIFSVRKKKKVKKAKKASEAPKKD